MKLKDKVAVVTGASRGLGKGIARALATEGALVVVAARTEDKGKLPGTIHQTVDEIKSQGGRAVAIKTNLVNEEEIDYLFKKTIDDYGRIDILVNNAGVTTQESLLETTTKRWDLIMSVNLRGTFLCTRAALPTMIDQQSGSIINLSSILGTQAIAGPIAYGVTKAAIERFTQGLAQEIKSHNIAVNAICPSFTNTEGARSWAVGIDTSNWQTVEMWGKYAVFLACQDASTLTGRFLYAEDLQKLVS